MAKAKQEEEATEAPSKEKTQHFQWLGGPDDVVHSRVHRELEGVLFSGDHDHIAKVVGEDKIKFFSEHPDFQVSSLEKFKIAGGQDEPDAVENGGQGTSEGTTGTGGTTTVNSGGEGGTGLA